MMHTDKHSDSPTTQPDNKNGVVTVNNSNNPTVQERDEMIGKEPDTDRVRSERESVQDAQHCNK